MNERITKYLQGELSESDRLDLLRLMSVDESLKQEFIRQKHLNALTHLSTHTEDEADGAASYRLFIDILDRKKRRKIFLTFSKYAAAVLFIIATTVYSTILITKEAPLAITMNKIYAPAGQRLQFTLQDGTTVWLNSNTTLTYPSHFSGDERCVSVIGEAFFDVAKNKEKPFVVSSQDVKIKVLGTQFNINSYLDSDYIRTSLLTGSVEILSSQIQGEESVILKPAQQATLRDGKMQVDQIENEDYFLWIDGIYAFENEELIGIIKRLELYYDVKIILANPEMFRVNYTGKFRQRDGIEDILHVIQRIHKFKIEIDREKNIITLQ